MEYFTFKQAAKNLNVSFDFLQKLVADEKLSWVIVGLEPRISQQVLDEYKAVRKKARHEAISEIIKISEQAGLYKREFEGVQHEDE